MEFQNKHMTWDMMHLDHVVVFDFCWGVSYGSIGGGGWWWGTCVRRQGKKLIICRSRCRWHYFDILLYDLYEYFQNNCWVPDNCQSLGMYGSWFCTGWREVEGSIPRLEGKVQSLQVLFDQVKRSRPPEAAEVKGWFAVCIAEVPKYPSVWKCVEGMALKTC